MQQEQSLQPISRASYLSELLRGVYAITSYLPWVWLGMFGLTLLVTIIQVGHWPSYANPDPASGGLMTIVYWPTIILTYVLFGFIPFWFGLLLLGLILPKVWRNFQPYVSWQYIGIYLLGMFVYYLIMGVDVFNLFGWFLD